MSEPTLQVAPTVELRPGPGRLRVVGCGGACVDLIGEAYVAVAERLAIGTSTATELVTALRAEFDALPLLRALTDLREVGAVIQVSAAAEARFAPQPIRIRLDQVGAAPLAERLAAVLVATGATVDPGAEPTTVSPSHERPVAVDVMVVGDWRAPADRLPALDRPWLAVHAAGADLRVGPVVVPGRAGCWTCLQARLTTTQPVADPADHVPSPLVVAWAGALVLSVAADLARGLPGRGVGRTGLVWTFEPEGAGWRPHHLLPWPDCPTCGGASGAGATAHPPIALPDADRSTGDAAVARGTAAETFGVRSVTAEATVAALERFVSPLLGPITALRAVPVEPPLFAYAADGNPAVDGVGAVQRSLRKRSGGKGPTAVAARASALAESLERLQGRWWRDRPRARARLCDADDSFLHPNTVQLFSDTQLAAGAAGDHGAYRDRTPAPFDPDEPADWTPLWSLTAGATRWLPSAICWFGYDAAPTTWVADSNGCGAGNTLTEAVLGGLLELVERDAVGIWWLNRLRRPAFDLTAAPDPWVHDALAQFAARGRPVHVLDVTNDLGIPAAAAVSAGPGEPPVMGFGAHPDGWVAVRRAMGEIVQMLGATRPQRSSGIVGPGAASDPVTARWMAKATVEDQPYLMPAGEPVPVPTPDEPTTPASDLEEVRRRVEGQGHEVLVLDQTRPEIGFPTVRVVAPGLRHFWHRAAPGRLYDVPVTLGWRREPLAEHELNPFTMPM